MNDLGLPSSPEFEKLVLGAVLVKDSLCPQLIASISSEVFTTEPNRRIFNSISCLYNAGLRIDRNLIAEDLIAKGQLEGIGLGYLVSLDENLPELPDLGSYIEVLLEKYRLRRAIYLGAKLQEMATDGRFRSSELLGELQDQLSAITRADGLDKPETIASYVNQRGPQRILSPQDRDPGVALGFAGIDQMIGGGLRESQILVIGARPSMGKTCVVTNIAEYISSNGLPVCVFSAEMPKSALINRMLVRRAGIGLNRFLRGDVGPEERVRLQEALASIYELPIYIDDTTGLTASDISSRVKALKDKPALVAIDYFQLLRSTSRGNGDERYTQIANDLQILAKETGIPLVILSQLSRDSSRRVAGKKDYRPQLEDFRGSGTIEQIANIGAFLFREELYEKDRNELKGLAEFIIRKNRDGQIGTAMLKFTGWRFEFTDGSDSA